MLELPSEPRKKPKNKADELFAAHDPSKPTKKTAPKAGKKRKKRGDPDDVETNDTADKTGGTDEPTTESAQPNNTSTASNPLVQELEELNIAAAAQAASNPTKGLQIMDLESDEPMIVYQGQMYGCRWATSLGSDLLFMRRPDSLDEDYNPLRSFKEVDLLAIGSARLVASHATIERKPDYLLHKRADPSTTNADLTIENEEIIRQASFFGRLADIKTRKGEAVGNLKSLADSVLADPNSEAVQKASNKRGGRPGPSAASPAPSTRRRPSAVARKPSQDVEPTAATTRSRRSSTRSVRGQSPAQLVQLDNDHEMIDAA